MDNIIIISIIFIYSIILQFLGLQAKGVPIIELTILYLHNRVLFTSSAQLSSMGGGGGGGVRGYPTLQCEVLLSFLYQAAGLLSTRYGMCKIFVLVITTCWLQFTSLLFAKLLYYNITMLQLV